MTWEKYPHALLSILTCPESVSKVFVGVNFVATANTKLCMAYQDFTFSFWPPSESPFLPHSPFSRYGS